MTLQWIILVGVPAVPLLITLLNLATWPRGARKSGHAAEKASGSARSYPSLAVLIPARNEGLNIEGAVSSCLSQDPNARGLLTEVLVYDDQSTDDTADKVRALAEKDARVRLISGGPVPHGWIGKPHACQQLFLASSASRLLFLDADVTLKPGALEQLSTLAHSQKADVLTAVPEQKTGSFFERLVLPLLLLTYTSWLPLFLVPRGKNTSTVAANGQLVLVSRETCEKLAGFSQVRDKIVDDVAFCRLAKASGMKVVFADGFQLAECRMYTGAREVWNGFSKNLFLGIGGSVLSLVLILSLYLTAFVGPYAALVLAILGPFPELWLPAATGVLLNLFLRAALALRFRQSFLSVLLHPLGVLALVLIALNSARWTRQGKISWKGRFYSGKTAIPSGATESAEPTSLQPGSYFPPVREES